LLTSDKILLGAHAVVLLHVYGASHGNDTCFGTKPVLWVLDGPLGQKQIKGRGDENDRWVCYGPAHPRHVKVKVHNVVDAIGIGDGDD